MTETVFEDGDIADIRMQNKQMSICENISGSVSVDGWMDAHFGPWALTLSKDYSLASCPSTKPFQTELWAELFQQISQSTVANTQPE